jgi:hypothetical protein
MELVTLKQESFYSNTLDTVLMREEVLDRILCIAIMIKKSKIQLEVDYISLAIQLKNNFSIDKTFTLMEKMQNDKQLEIYSPIFNLIKTYYIEILQLYSLMDKSSIV